MNIRDIAGFIHRHYKLSVFMIGAALLIMVFLFGADKKEKHVDASTYNVKYFKCITIEADDTLWSIAEENMSEEYSSINDYIDEVKSINALVGDKIYSGATLVVPYYAAPVEQALAN
ncbi:MAG: LysM peptidoglycan-binding domain-containing protein [Lachnospiraceae bacterium]|nr:LysM peptidoglycan-binding domain-containing protein [Lachnospiraceae bacterium]